jgi:hypothetical protein
VNFLKPYQVQDSSFMDNDVDPEGDSNGLEIIQEIDDSIMFSAPKFKQGKTIKDTGYQNIDTFYGIKNQENIPIRKIEKAPTTETVIERLFTPTTITREIVSWQIVILIITIILIGLSKAFSRNRFNQAIKALFNYGVAQEITREEKVFFHRSNVLFTIVHLLTVSLLLYHLKEFIHSSNLEIGGIVAFLLILLAITIIYIVKYIFSRILLFVLNDVSITSEYIFNVSLFNNLLGVLFIPILCISYFSSFSFSLILLYLVIPLSLITFVLRMVRMVMIGNGKGISYFYIFLYICTLEILPLVVLFRIFIL